MSSILPQVLLDRRSTNKRQPRCPALPSKNQSQPSRELRWVGLSHEPGVARQGQSCAQLAIDGTWRRSCILEDASDSGARLSVEGSVEGLLLKEFFLLLSSTGLAYRRCQLAWVNGAQIGVHFLKAGSKRKTSAAKASA
jgi:hypothetical protein